MDNSGNCMRGFLPLYFYFKKMKRCHSSSDLLVIIKRYDVKLGALKWERESWHSCGFAPSTSGPALPAGCSLWLCGLPDAVRSCQHPVGCNEGSSAGVTPLAIGIVLKGGLGSTCQVRLRLLLTDFISLLHFLHPEHNLLLAF